MAGKLLIVVLIMTLLFGMMQPSAAEPVNPVSLNAPQHFGVSYSGWGSFWFTFSLPEDRRAYIDAWAKEDPDSFNTSPVHFQIDYRIDNGGWHYAKAWDAPEDGLYSTPYYSFYSGGYYQYSDSWDLALMFPEEDDLAALDDAFLNTRSITFRMRFIETFDNGDTYVHSPWSEEFTLSSKMNGDPEEWINHAPVLKEIIVKESDPGPVVELKTGRIPGTVQDLHAATGGAVTTEIWGRKKGETQFSLLNYEWSNWESLIASAGKYFNGDESTGFEIKLRYALDLADYKQSNRSDTIYSPFSNVISYNMPVISWSNASQWALGELQKACDHGLFPNKLQNTDLTRPITRAEFAAVAVKLYEALSGKTTQPAPSNTFSDTKDVDVLKAYALDIVAGVGNNRFAPDEHVNREQAAAMLTRVYKKLNWEGWTLAGDNTYKAHSLDNSGVAPFADDSNISDWAKPSVYFMAKYEIIKGLGGNKFAPKNTTDAEIAAGYANATREQALLISSRTFEKAGLIKDGGPVGSVPSSPTNPKAMTDSEMEEWLVGTWGYSDSNGNTDMDLMYVFNSDGTFYNVLSSSWRGWRTGTMYKGKYMVKGSQLILTDLLKSTGHVVSENFTNIWHLTMDTFDTRDVPSENMEHPIEKDKDGKLKIDDTLFTRGK